MMMRFLHDLHLCHLWLLMLIYPHNDTMKWKDRKCHERRVKAGRVDHGKSSEIT
jgi:hypothetical protein